MVIRLQAQKTLFSFYIESNTKKKKKLDLIMEVGDTWCATCTLKLDLFENGSTRLTCVKEDNK